VVSRHFNDLDAVLKSDALPGGQKGPGYPALPQIHDKGRHNAAGEDILATLISNGK
jgi:hypothetical protein